MIITKQLLAVKMLSYLQHKTTLGELVEWAESAFMDGDLQGDDPEVVRDILARLGLADVKTFGLFWDECEDIMRRLGYVLKVDGWLVA